MWTNRNRLVPSMFFWSCRGSCAVCVCVFLVVPAKRLTPAWCWRIEWRTTNKQKEKNESPFSLAHSFSFLFNYSTACRCRHRNDRHHRRRRVVASLVISGRQQLELLVSPEDRFLHLPILCASRKIRCLTIAFRIVKKKSEPATN